MRDDEDDGAAIFGGRKKYREDERAVGGIGNGTEFENRERRVPKKMKDG